VSKDTAKATFDIAMGRAEYLLRLAYGLTNVRHYRIRKDWAAKFRQLMHWPQAHAIERIDSKDAVVVLRDASNLRQEDFSSKALKDLLRASLVMAVSAMDAYFHAKIIQHVVEHSRKKEPSNKLLNERILVKYFIEGRKKTRTNVALRAAVEQNLSYQSLQQPDPIREALGLIGISDFWTRVAQRLGKEQRDLHKELSRIVKRRNQIAHEGDLSQSKKARNKSRTISHKEVERDIALIEEIIEIAEEEINKQLL